jgi:hypothetical protein
MNRISQLVQEIRKYFSTREGIHRLVILFCIFIWIFRFLDGTLLHHVYGAPLSLARTDRLFWWAHAAGIPFWLRSNGLIWDFGLLVALLFQFIFPGKMVWVALSCLGWMGLHIGYYSAYAYHSHVLLGIIFIHLPLLVFYSAKWGELSWDGIRFYALFTYFSAAFWKIGRGALFHKTHFADIVWLNRSDNWLGYSVDSLISLSWLKHESLWQVAWILLITWQLSFLIGLFTRRLDRYFALSIVAFHAFSSFFLHVPIGAMAVYALVFIRLPKSDSLSS